MGRNSADGKAAVNNIVPLRMPGVMGSGPSGNSGSDVASARHTGLVAVGASPQHASSASFDGDPHFKTWSGTKFDFQ
jgi:hypothetical protein